MANKRAYEYTSIADLSVDKKSVNIFGIVKYFQPPKHVKKTGQYNALYTVIDPSLGELIENGARCNLFAAQKEMLPDAQIGDIIRFHRLKIDEFNGRLQLKATKGYSWLVFNSTKTSFSHPNAIITTEDDLKVKELRVWYNNIKHKLLDRNSLFLETKLCDIKPESFFNCVVYVIRVACFGSEPNCLLTVSDGSKVRYSSFPPDGFIESDLCSTIKQYCFDICVFDDLAKDALKLQPGSIIKLVNVHAKNVSNVDTVQKNLNLNPIAASNGWVELVIHTGTHYGKELTVLPRDDEKAKNLIKEMLHVREMLESSISKTEQNQVRPLQESLTITDFPLNPFKTLDEVKASTVPNKFRLRIKVIGIKPSTVKECIIGVCGSCEEFVQLDDFLEEIALKDTMQCHNCKNDIINITYAFEILVKDSTGFLQIKVFGNNALKFFNNIKPSLLLRDPNMMLNYEDKFKRIWNEGKSFYCDLDLPWVEMCIFSFRNMSQPIHPTYNLFATSLI